MLTVGDTPTTITNTKKTGSTKTLTRRTPEQRATLKPLWNIIPNSIITNYSPTSIILYTNTRRDTVIRKNDLAVITETKPR